MTLSLFRVTSFDGYTLHNGSTRFAKEWIENDVVGQLNIIQLANGQFYDMNLSDDAPQIPQPFTTNHVLKLPTKAEADAEAATLKSLIGRRGSVVAEPYGGSAPTESCTARLEKASIEKRLKEPGSVLVVNLLFNPISNWS